MFTTLFMKEIQETIQTSRFLIAALLCMTLIPLGLFITMKNYQQRLTDYHNTVRAYIEQSRGRIYNTFEAEGYREPSMLSIFSTGLENVLPDKVVTSRNSGVRAFKEANIDNPYSFLFGKIDFVFNVGFVLSLLALIFTFSGISGEKESATLRLVLSNAVPRWKILLAKMAGNYIVFLVPFILSLVIGLLSLSISTGMEIVSGYFLKAYFTIIAVAMVFMLSMFNLGLLVSTLTHRSLTSMVTLLFVWVVMVLVIPKLSPMVAEAIYPIKSMQVVSMEKKLAVESIEKETDHKRRVLFEQIMTAHGADYSSLHSRPSTDAEKRAYEQYDREVTILDEENLKRKSGAIAQIDRDFAGKRAIQTAFTVNLARTSPVSCFSFIVTELSGTGLLETENFREQAGRFEERVKTDVYDNFLTKRYGTTAGGTSTSTTIINNFDPRKAPAPTITDYKHITVTEALKMVWVDGVLLALYAILFFTGAFVSFLRYDVR